MVTPSPLLVLGFLIVEEALCYLLCSLPGARSPPPISTVSRIKPSTPSGHLASFHAEELSVERLFNSKGMVMCVSSVPWEVLACTSSVHGLQDAFLGRG